MSNILIRAFTDETLAKNCFQNEIVESEIVDGIFIKTAGMALARKLPGGAFVDLTDGDACYLVISYNRGTGIQVDSGTSADQAAGDGEGDGE